MIARAGTSTCLSVGIVVLAAIVLHRPESPRTVAGVVKSSRPVPKPEKVAAKADPVAKPAPTSRHLPDSPLTQVQEGETFADVALRVYGNGADLDAFWKMNRDQLATRDAEVRPGMVLRTPPL